MNIPKVKLNEHQDSYYFRFKRANKSMLINGIPTQKMIKACYNAYYGKSLALVAEKHAKQS